MGDTDMGVTFTEAEVDLCLAQAACLRASYAARNPDGTPDYTYSPEQIAESIAWDNLARKLASTLGPDFELEQECGHCIDGVSHGRTCAACNGTGLWPVELPVEPAASVDPIDAGLEFAYAAMREVLDG